MERKTFGVMLVTVAFLVAFAGCRKTVEISGQSNIVSPDPAPAQTAAPLDVTLPTVSVFSVPSSVTSLVVSVSAFSATDNVGVTGYLINESATKPSAAATGWSATPQSSYAFSSAGAKTLYAWAKDAAGNVSSSRTAAVTITLADTAAPAVSAFAIPASMNSLTVSVTTFTATDNVGVTGYLINESATKPSAAATGWSATPQSSYAFSSAGAKTLYAWAKDAAGNVSSSRTAAVTITLPQATGSATLSWDASLTFTDGSPLTDLTGYVIYYGTASGSYPTSIPLNDPAAVSHVVEGLVSGTTYYFVVTAVSASGGESDYSNEASKIIP